MSFSEYAGKTAIVTGALNALGQALVRDLAASDCRVLALDAEEQGLRQLAMSAPQMIEAVRLDCGDPENCAVLGEVWQDEPLHLLVVLHGLTLADHAHSGRDLTDGLLTLLSGLSAGLMQGKGAGVVVFTSPNQATDAHSGVATTVATAAMRQAIATLAQDLRPGGARLNGLMLTEGGNGARAGAALGFLAGSASRGINGATIPLDLSAID